MPNIQPNSGNQGDKGQGKHSEHADNARLVRIDEEANGGIRKSLDYMGPVQNPKEPPTSGGTKRPKD